MLIRKLEPEVMDTPEEAIDYDRMDHSGVNRLFVDDFLKALAPHDAPPSQPLRVFDAGTGTAQIPIELLRRGFPLHVTASDLAESMLAVAQQNVDDAGFKGSIELVLCDCKQLPYTDASFDAVMSNSIVHHIPEPRRVLHELWRVLKPGGLYFIRDLMRPDDERTLEHMVQTYAGDANGHQQQMFRDSLHAALTVLEVRDLLKELVVSPDAVQATSDRHWTVQIRKAQ
jgi:ubiquinone/menaquinone biosynthesis C-methylase UbiE